MENDERIANIIYGLITLTDKVDLGMQEDGYKRISGVFQAIILNRMYTIVTVVHKKYFF